MNMDQISLTPTPLLLLPPSLVLLLPPPSLNTPHSVVYTGPSRFNAFQSGNGKIYDIKLLIPVSVRQLFGIKV